MNSAITKRSPPASKGCARAIVAALRSSDRASELTLRRLIAEATGEQGSGGGYRAHVDCVEAEVPFRPPRPEKRVHNTTETAVVVGPRLVKGHDEDRGKRGAEIHTDEYGRVKVQFHWDREGQWDDRTSCWIRVAQPWAGAGFGFQFFPRVGMEVLVAFMGGDPDRPVVVGSLYNATHPTPELLPDRQTRSGIRTQSTPGGGGFNELSFEDRKGTERVFLHAEKDFEEVVNDTHSLNVKNEQVLVVKHHREVSVGAELVAVENNQSSIVGHNRVSRTGGSVNTVVQVHDTCRVGGDAFATVEGLAVRAHRRDDVTAIDGNTSASVNGDYLMQINGRDELSAAHHVTFVNGSSFTKVRDSLAVKAGDDDDDNERREIRLECGTSSLRLLPDAIEMSADVLALRGTRTVAIEHAIGAIEIGSDGLTICVDRATLQTPDGAALTLTGGRVRMVAPERWETRSAEIDFDSQDEDGADRPEHLVEGTPPVELCIELTHLYPEADAASKLKGARYRLVAEGSVFEGHTDGDGRLNVHVPPQARTASLTVWPGWDAGATGERLDWFLHLVHELPGPAADPLSAARVRLRNLGYRPGPLDDPSLDAATLEALRAFQRDNGLAITLDHETPDFADVIRIYGR